MEPLRFRQTPQDSRILQNQPTSFADSPSEEVVGDTDEPPDGAPLANMRQEQQFKKILVRGQEQRKQSLLTQNLHSSASESDSSHHDEDVFSPSTRAHSSASNWSRGSFASTADLTSDGQTSPNRTRTPSPPSPRIRLPMSPNFNIKPFANPATVKIVENGIDPLRTSTPLSANEDKVEAGLGRKRCIMFACGKKDEPKKEEAIKVEEPKPMLPAKRPCALTFACPTRTSSSTNNNQPHIRIASPAPARRVPQSPKPSLRSHRGSDVTVRTISPRTVRKPSVVRARRSSAASEADPYEATRFHEFASSEEERDDWVQEQTCHRSRLTIDDTLKVENTLRKLGKEVEEEVLEEDEEEELDQGLGNEEEDVDEDEDDDNDSIGMVDSTGYLTDEGFQTDDEEGFAGSDDDSDTGSDFAWWVPSNSGGDHVEHIRPSRPRSDSGSSIGSFSSTRVCPAKSATIHHRRKKTTPVDFRPRTPELPDSTDFVCGTLDEDRPLEHAYYSCLQQRRAAKHVPVPQDIDPTFPTSDPEMDEEDEDSDENEFLVDESDHHMFLHGAPDASDSDSRESRSIVPKKRSPNHSPKRLRSPPPAKRGAYHHSPPSRRLRSPPPTARRRSPPPALRHRSPPSTIRLRSPPAARLRSPAPVIRRASFLKHMEDMNATPIALHGPPKSGRMGTNSLPRNGAFARTRPTIENMAMYDEDCEDDDLAADLVLPRRAAIDIVKGLEKKRQRRKEKLDEKDRRMRAKGNQKKHAHHVLPGRGAARMREMGVELAALRGKRPVGSPTEQGQHILSY